MTTTMVVAGSVAVTRLGCRATTAPPLVVLHGGGPGCHAEADFRALLPLLPDRDTLLVDLPGYGATPLRRPPRPRFSGYADTLVTVLDALGIDECDILAQSLGGIAGLVLGASEPHRIRRLVAIGSQPVPPPGGIRVDSSLGVRARAAYYGSGELTRERLRQTVMTLEWREPDRIPDDLVAARHAASVTEDGLAVAKDPTLLGEPEDLSGLPEAVATEALIVWGEHDPFGEPAYGEWLAGRLRRGSVAVVHGAAHHPQSELPEVTGELIAAPLT